MQWLILGIILIAVYNATAAIMEWKSLRWTVAVYWCAVAAYWMARR